MTIRPYGKFILVKPHEKKQVLVSDDGNLCEYGEVIAVGHQTPLTQIKVGDVIGYSVFGIEKLVVDDEKFYLVSPEFVLGFIE